MSKTTARVSWVGQVPVGTDPTGNPRYLRRTFKLKREADAWVADVRREMKTGGVVEPSKMMVSEYLDHWLDTAGSQSVRASTAASYRSMVETYLKPHLGSIRLAELLPLMIQTAYAKLQDGGSSPRTVRYAHSVLHNALAQAVEWRMITRNPTQAVKLPKQVRKEMTPLNAEEAADFIALSRAYRLGALLELALVSGMRPGELRALHWCDVDLDGGVVRVRHAMADTPDGSEVNEPKTKRGNRTIPVPPQTVETLRQWKAKQAEERISAGTLWRGVHRPADGLVFTSPLRPPARATQPRQPRVQAGSPPPMQAPDAGSKDGGSWRLSGGDRREARAGRDEGTAVDRSGPRGAEDASACMTSATRARRSCCSRA